jgi:hypothetical protein
MYRHFQLDDFNFKMQWKTFSENAAFYQSLSYFRDAIFWLQCFYSINIAIEFKNEIYFPTLYCVPIFITTDDAVCCYI